MTTNIKSNYIEIKNGKIIDKESVNLDYDGDNLNIAGTVNNTDFDFTLDNQDLIDLISQPKNNHTLKQQLLHDFDDILHTSMLLDNSCKKYTRKTSKKSGRKASKKTSRKSSKKTSTRASSKTNKKTSTRASSRTSKRTSKKSGKKSK